MPKPELGTKRNCPACAARFYDLHKEPVQCPKCGETFEPEVLLKPRRQRAPKAEEVKPEPAKEEEAKEAEGSKDTEESKEEEEEEEAPEIEELDLEKAEVPAKAGDDQENDPAAKKSSDGSAEDDLTEGSEDNADALAEDGEDDVLLPGLDEDDNAAINVGDKDKGETT